VGVHSGVTPLRTIWQFPIKFNTYLAYDLAILLLDRQPSERKMFPQNSLYAKVHSSFIHSSSKLEARWKEACGMATLRTFCFIKTNNKDLRKNKKKTISFPALA
jgi:hypothetical protein